MSFENQSSIFDTVFDHEDVLDIPEDYLQVRLNEMENKEIFSGKPQMSSTVNVREFDTDDFNEDGTPKTRKVYQLRCIIVNDDEEQYLDININLKSEDLKVTNIRKGSVLFDFISSIHELENKGSTKGKNIISNANLKQYIDFINGLESMSVQNIERTGRYNFNSFYVVKVNNKGL